MRQLKVYFDSKSITNKQVLSLEEVQNQPKIEFSTNGQFYTIVMLDPDAPSRDNPIYANVLHWLVINNEDVIIPYSPPNPPAGSGFHRYHIHCLKQNDKIVLKGKIEKRQNFDLLEFMKTYNLSPIASIMFRCQRDNEK